MFARMAEVTSRSREFYEGAAAPTSTVLLRCLAAAAQFVQRGACAREKEVGLPAKPV